jgi:hypothetical protein
MLLDAFRLYFFLVCAMKKTNKYMSFCFSDVKTKQKTEKTEVKPHKNKHELQTKHSPKKKTVFVWFLEVLVVMHIHIL